MTSQRGSIALGFDVGETLLTYADIPLSWVEQYPAALTAAARACELAPSSKNFALACARLSEFNTRLHPRRVETTAEKIFEPIVKAWGSDSREILGSAIRAFFEFFQQRMAAYPETRAVLLECGARNIPMGALTDVPYGMPREFVLRDLAAAAVNDLLPCVITSVEVGVRKPEAQGFQMLAEKLGVTTDRLWYVGNEEKDIVGARNVGAVAIMVDRDNRHPAWGQHHTIRDLSGLLDLL